MKLTIEDYKEAASRLKWDLSLVQAFAKVEANGEGFLSNGNVKILFERHHFHRLTKGKFSAQYPQISNANPGGYLGGAQEYVRFGEAMKLDPVAAMMSCSWGKFQIMGFNFAVCGFTSIHAFVDAMKTGERAHLLAFVEFIKHNGLDDEGRRKDYAGLARGYNGKNYKKNNYDQKLRHWDQYYAAQKNPASPKPIAQPAPVLQEPVTIAIEPTPEVSTAAPAIKPEDVSTTDSQPSNAQPLNNISLDSIGGYAAKLEQADSLMSRVSTSSIVNLVWKHLLAIAMFVYGTLEHNWEYLVIGVVVLLIAAWLWNESKKRATVRTLRGGQI